MEGQFCRRGSAPATARSVVDCGRLLPLWRDRSPAAGEEAASPRGVRQQGWLGESGSRAARSPKALRAPVESHKVLLASARERLAGSGRAEAMKNLGRPQARGGGGSTRIRGAETFR